MRTTLNLDEAILEEVMQLTQQTNRSEAVRLGLQAFIQDQKKQQVLDLRGSLELENNWAASRYLAPKS